jgi:hypothetical protein
MLSPMALGIRWFLVGLAKLCVLNVVAGCSIGSFFAEREPWRLEAEAQCVNAGIVREGAGVVRTKAIQGPGVCGAEYPLRVSILDESTPLGYAGEVRPSAAYPSRSAEPDRLPPVAVSPSATLACPIVSELERWIAGSVQPAAMRWFGSPVAEVKQISAYSCRGLNGNPMARISEHAFGNALDIASFTLADGRIVTVRSGWHGLPEEQGFLRDIQGAACDHFTTVLAPGSNVFHSDHIHVDLMRRRSGRSACNPGAVSGAEIAARAQARYGRRGGVTSVTGALGDRFPARRPHSAQARARGLPVAEPGNDGEHDD